MKKYYALMVCAAALTGVPALAYAEEEAAAPVVESAEEETKAEVREAAPEDSKAQAGKGVPEASEKSKEVPEILSRLVDFEKKLEPTDKQHFRVLYTNYNIIGVVKTVRRDVGNAVDACGEENPDMAEDLGARFKAWTDAVDPVVEEADGLVNNMLFAQSYASPREIRDIFKLLDDSREQHEKGAQKVPVTTEEACTYLLNKMDETQERMVGLLRATLLSLPKTLQEAKERAKGGAGP